MIKLAAKSKLIIALTLTIVILAGIRFLATRRPPETPPLIPGTFPQPSRQPLVRRFIPAPFLPATPEPITITAVDPQPNEAKVGLFRPIILTFNQKVDPLSVTLSLSPPLILSLPTASDEATLVFNHQTLFQAEINYQVTALLNNRPLLSWSFTTAKTQYDPDLFQDIESFHRENYPLIDFVPYQSEQVIVNYVGPKKLVVKLIAGTKQEALAEVATWMRSHNVDPKSHLIEWE